MDDPFEKEQNLLRARIISRMETLNESMATMNKNLQEINRKNLEIENVTRMWSNYMRYSDQFSKVNETPSGQTRAREQEEQ
ncbi:uncharacterized protein SPAPADRAFT_59275 [Spathaspora passalidarum NRRL Y-27907]|uniref:DASH complex subunit DAD4 n=1 Tax=Spathaspora passalidarum (strain NRRL Y-27907 / 11-Y1) TaxID=619300 RepID=G3AJJ5_SPAPN|nr:uncharacterized protein SPAPADRAFT_59275 [Spathaspora passalidarum NRRL Y-27907]EGW33898.1 hypothetical protein SPAPADRAFT_59275 [Spathaspora passalidarum NRRL Y-27907]